MEQRSYTHVCILAFLAMACRVIRVILASPSPHAGVCYGTLGDNLPSPTQVISTLETCGVAKFRIYEAQPEILQPSHLLVSLTMKNRDILNVASDPKGANNWVKENFVPYKNIYEIVVGNEAIPGENAPFVVSAMYSIRSAISQTDRPDTPVTTSISIEALANTFTPSEATFAPDVIEIMTQVVKFFSNSPPWAKKLYVNVYPYFAYANDPARFSPAYALFRSSEPIVRDNNLEYTNLFDATFDSFVWALEKIGGENVSLTVGETGWPSAGNGNFTTPTLASTYNTNLYNHLVNNKGSPKRPNDGFRDFYISSMFNENQKPAGVGQNWGLYDANLQHVYATPLC